MPPPMASFIVNGETLNASRSARGAAGRSAKGSRTSPSLLLRWRYWLRYFFRSYVTKPTTCSLGSASRMAAVRRGRAHDERDGGQAGDDADPDRRDLELAAGKDEGFDGGGDGCFGGDGRLRRGGPVALFRFIS